MDTMWAPINLKGNFKRQIPEIQLAVSKFIELAE